MTQVLDVWGSREQFEPFANGPLRDAIGRLMGQGGTQMEGEPSFEFTEFFDIVKGRWDAKILFEAAPAQ